VTASIVLPCLSHVHLHVLLNETMSLFKRMSSSLSSVLVLACDDLDDMPRYGESGVAPPHAPADLIK
jgi:hypothetical protein